MGKWYSLAIVAVLAASGTAEAEAGSRDARTCALVEGSFVAVDGMLDEWNGIRYSMVGGGPDSAFRFRCAYDDKKLYLSFDVKDDRIVRTRAAKLNAEDHISIKLRGTGRAIRINVLPGSLTAKRKILVGSRKPKWLEVEDSLQPNGFSLELAMPRARVPGIGKNTPIIFADIAYNDTDRAMAKKIERRRRFKGVLYTEAGARTHRAFLKALKLSGSDLRFDQLADVDTSRGAERIVAAGKYVAVLSDTFAFMQLPVKSAADIVKLRLLDFDGSGRSFLVGQYRQHGGGGSREVVSVWEFKGDGSFGQVVGFEIAKKIGDSKLVARWELVKRGALRKLDKKESRRGFDIYVEAGTADGFGASSWNELPATDVHPILLPWSKHTRTLYSFDGNVAQKAVLDARLLKRWLKSKR